MVCAAQSEPAAIAPPKGIMCCSLMNSIRSAQKKSFGVAATDGRAGTMLPNQARAFRQMIMSNNIYIILTSRSVSAVRARAQQRRCAGCLRFRRRAGAPADPFPKVRWPQLRRDRGRGSIAGPRDQGLLLSLALRRAAKRTGVRRKERSDWRGMCRRSAKRLVSGTPDNQRPSS